MKAQVIFYSALAFLLDLVASIPYAADLQRYSNQYQSRPSLDQTNFQRPYHNVVQRPYDGVYNNPPPLYQEQELPRIQQDNYFARSQQTYMNKGPPPIQPEIPNERYINQQRLPNLYYSNVQEPVLHSQNDNWRQTNRQINENPPVRYPEHAIDERDTPYRNYQQQVIQNNRFPENVRTDVRKTTIPAEESYPVRQSPTYENRGLIGNGSPHQERVPYEVSQSGVHNNPLSIEGIPQLQSLPEILIEKTFAPSIPSAPTRNIMYSSNVLKQVNDHYLQVQPVQEGQIPVVSPPTSHVENGTPLSANETHLARAGNPVEQTPEPQVQPKPNVEPIISTKQRIQNLLSTTKHTKRYLVLYPNGTIEHINKLETVKKQHPNFILVNAGDLVSNTARKGNVEKASTAAPTKPVKENSKPVNRNASPVNKYAPPVNKKTIPSLSYEPSSFEVEVIKTPSTQVPKVPTTTSAPKPVATATAPANILYTTATAPVRSVAQAVVSSNATPDESASQAVASGPNVTAIASANQAGTTTPTPQAPTTLPTPHAHPTDSTPMAAYGQEAASTPAFKAQTTTPVPQPQTTAPAPAPLETTTSAPAPLATSTCAPAPLDTSTSAPAPLDTSTSAPAPLENSTSTPALLETSTSTPITATPKNIQPSEQEINKEVLPPLHNDTENAEKNPQDEPATAFAVATASVIQSTSAPPTVPASTENPQQDTPSTQNIEEVTSTPAPVSESTPQPDQTTVTVLEIEDKPQEVTTGSNNSTEAPLVVPVLYEQNDESPHKNIDEFILNEASNRVEPNPDETVPDLGDSDILANVHQKPVVWFRTSDPNFWKKLTDKNTGFDVVYFFQIHNQPKVVHDTKTTLFPNGTVLEEFTETLWEYEGAEPQVTKTTKLTDPDDQ